MMKKIIAITCFLFMLLNGAFTQGYEPPVVYPGTQYSSGKKTSAFRFALQTSPTWSWIRTNDKLIEGTGSNWGLKLNLQGEFYFGNPQAGEDRPSTYAFIAGLGWGFNEGGTLINNYQKNVSWPKSAEESPTIPDTLSQGARFHYRLTYVEVPLGFKLHAGINDDLKFWAEIPVFTLGFVNKAVGDIRGTNGLDTEDEIIREDVNGLSLSWGLGAGLEYRVNDNLYVVGGLQYQQQFTDATEDNGFVLDSRNNQWKKEDSAGHLGMIGARLGITLALQ